MGFKWVNSMFFTCKIKGILKLLENGGVKLDSCKDMVLSNQDHMMDWIRHLAPFLIVKRRTSKDKKIKYCIHS